MKKAILSVLSLILVLALAACSGGDRPSGSSGETTANSGGETTASSGKEMSPREKNNEIFVGIANDLSSSLGPWQLSTAGTREVMFNVYEGLYKTDPTGDFKPALATDCQISEDGLTYTFTLRQGVKFHNGAQVTGADVVHSFKTCAETAVDSAMQGVLANMADISAQGDKITLRLSTPNSDFMAYVSSVYISPAAYTDQDTKPVGTGPFRFVSRTVQDSVVLERFEDYWGEKAKLSKVTFKIFENATALVTALDAGSVDLVAHLSASQVSSLKEDYKVLDGSMNLVQALYLNNAQAPLNDVRVRQALCYAVDVEAMLQLTADGHGSRLGSSIYPSFSKYFDASLVDAYPHNTEKAKSLLAEAGYPQGFDLTIIAPSNYSVHVNTAMVLAEQLKVVGINATVQEVEWNTWLTDVYKGRQFQATVCGFDASTLTANALLGRFESTSSKNMCGYASESFDAFMKEANATTDDARRTELFKAAAKCLSDDAANVYLQDLADFVAIRSNLKGYVFYPIYVMDLSQVCY